MNQLVTITGAGGNGGQAIARTAAAAGYRLRLADMVMPPPDVLALGEFIRCDTRSVTDVQQAIAGADAVIHLAAWHSALRPPVSDATIFAVNIDGTFNVFEACRAEGIGAIVYASSMAYGWGSVYGLTKVLGEEMCRTYHEITGASIAMLRYHEFVPAPYLTFGPRLLRNGVDRQDVADATVAALTGALDHRFGLFRTIVHTAHGIPDDVLADFPTLGPAWLESQVPGAIDLIAKYEIPLPERVEQHNLSEATEVIGWAPKVGFLDFLRDLKERDARGEDVRSLVVPGTMIGID
ncbi:MAG: NAD-dependent epimerase/dehydratase family protein [Thermomicrobiales bacterium]